MHKKKAFLLIEVLVYISISMILISISFTMMFSLVKIYKSTLEESKIITSENDCYLNIARLLKRNEIESISVCDNNLCIKCVNENGVEEIDVIERVGDKIIIKYYSKYGKEKSNVLIGDITGFYVTKKENVIYITIIKGGIAYKWCI